MKNLAVIGYPVMHSLSPKMHNFISEKLGLDYHYRHEEVTGEELEKAVLRLKKEGISGFNVTAPHKTEIIRYLDRISPDAKAYGSVNTVVCENGEFVGYSTDAEGFYKSLLHSGIEVCDKDILVLGAGGAAMPVCMHLATKKPKSLTVQNRTKEKAELVGRKVFDYCGYAVKTEAEHKRYDIIINCTTLGMGKNEGLSPLSDYSVIDSGTFVYDMIYAPRETELLKQAKMRGAKTANGLGMLAFQGALAYELFTGHSVGDELVEKIIKEVL